MRRSSRARSGASSASRYARERRRRRRCARSGARSTFGRVSVRLDAYPHRTGEHCASTAVRNLLAHHGNDLSEAMVFGLASGAGFFYFKNDALSPTRMFHGRTPSFEANLAANTGVALAEHEESDDARAEQQLRDRLDAGVPVLLATDTFYM